MHSARFGSPYAKISPRSHFTLKKMGVSDAMESNIFDMQKPNRTSLANSNQGQKGLEKAE
jgi:hypothetical protein